jgi:hypothetical protein
MIIRQGTELTELAVPEPQKSTRTVSSGTVAEPAKATDYLIRQFQSLVEVQEGGINEI